MFARRRRVALLLTALPWSLLPGTAHADPPPRDPAAAEALYKTGRDLLSKGDWQGACPKFDASMQLDPVASTLINLAKCHEHDNQLASAWADYQRAQVLNQDTPGAERQKALADVLRESLAALEPRLPRIRLNVEPRPDGLEVTRDGATLPLGSLGELVPIDPGEHHFHASAPGFIAVERDVTTAEGKVETVEIKLVAVSKPSPPTPASQPSSASRKRPIPIWPFVTGAVGLGLVAAGAGLRADGAAAESRLDAKCGTNRICDPAAGYDPGPDNRRKNVDYGLFVGFVVSGSATLGATVIGTIVEALRPSPGEKVVVIPWLVPGAGGASLGGRFF